MGTCIRISANFSEFVTIIIVLADIHTYMYPFTRGTSYACSIKMLNIANVVMNAGMERGRKQESHSVSVLGLFSCAASATTKPAACSICTSASCSTHTCMYVA